MFYKVPIGIFELTACFTLTFLEPAPIKSGSLDEGVFLYDVQTGGLDDFLNRLFKLLVGPAFLRIETDGEHTPDGEVIKCRNKVLEQKMFI